MSLLPFANKSGGATPGGSTTQVQFNDSGLFAGAAKLVWDKVNNFLGLGGTPSEALHVVGGNARVDGGSLKYQASAAPTVPVATASGVGILNGSYSYRVSFATAGGEVPGVGIVSVSPVNQQVSLTSIPTDPSGIATARNIYRSVAGGAFGTEKFLTTINDNTTTIYTDNAADGSLGAQIKGFSTAGGSFFLNGNPFAWVGWDSAAQNAYFGYLAGNSSRAGIGANSVGIGDHALASMANASQNTAVGSQALSGVVDGGANIAIGYQAMQTGVSPANNVAIGTLAMTGATNNSNTAVGYNALKGLTSGSSNVAVGASAGVSNSSLHQTTTGISNTYIGNLTGSSVNTQLSNATALGANAAVGQSNSLVLGSIKSVNGASTSVNVGIGTTTPSTALHVVGRINWNVGNTIPSANNLTLGTDGAIFHISGTTQVNLIDNTGWAAGAMITLIFDGALTVKNNFAGSSNFRPILLNAGVDFTTAANSTLTLFWDSSTNWVEIARKT